VQELDSVKAKCKRSRVVKLYWRADARNYGKRAGGDSGAEKVESVLVSVSRKMGREMKDKAISRDCFWRCMVLMADVGGRSQD
jgi:hypothetical protein